MLFKDFQQVLQPMVQPRKVVEKKAEISRLALFNQGVAQVLHSSTFDWIE
jgi:hypothetical protein